MLKHKEQSLEKMRKEASFEQVVEDALASLNERNTTLREEFETARDEQDAALMELAAMIVEG